MVSEHNDCIISFLLGKQHVTWSSSSRIKQNNTSNKIYYAGVETFDFVRSSVYAVPYSTAALLGSCLLLADSLSMALSRLWY
jgi:hypothetical protein